MIIKIKAKKGEIFAQTKIDWIGLKKLAFIDERTLMVV